MGEFWKNELTAEDEERLIGKVVEQVSKHKLQTPAVLFLEMHKPLGYIASQAAIAFSPFIGPFVGMNNLDEFTKLIAKRESVEKLIQRIEESAHINDDEEPR